MIYISLKNWKKPIFRILKSKKINKEPIKPEIKDPAVRIVYKIINNQLISKLETRQPIENDCISYSDYIAKIENDCISYSDYIAKILDNNSC